MNKKTIIAISLIALVLVGLGIYSYMYQNSPQSIVEKSTETNQEKINSLLTGSFVERIKQDSPSNKEYLESAVSDYTTKETVEKITITEREAERVKTELILKITTTNSKTGFSIATRDFYSVSLLKVNGSWKIDNYELTKSETIK